MKKNFAIEKKLSIFDSSNKTTMKNLIDILTAETQTLKEQYIQFTSEWAAKEFIKKTDWLKEYSMFMETKYKNTEYIKANNVYFNPEYRQEYLLNYRNEFDNIDKEIKDGKANEFVEKQIKNAEKHYTQSIAKLALRIEQKQLNINNLKAVTSHIGMNIDTTLTDGEKVVRAFTIIANGEINRPHYRYLIK